MTADATYHDRRLARKLQDPEFRAGFERQKREIECGRYGHQWNVVERLAVGPVEIVCERCGEARPVGGRSVTRTRPEEPTP